MSRGERTARARQQRPKGRRNENYLALKALAMRSDDIKLKLWVTENHHAY